MVARRVLLVLTGLLAGWTVTVAVTGGGATELAGLRLSSRNPATPLILAILAAAAAWWLARPGGVRTLMADVAAAWPWARRWLPADRSPWNVVTVVIVVGIVYLQIAHWAAAQPLWLDEQMLALNLRARPLWTLAEPLWLAQTAPVGWLALQRLAVVTLGESEMALRWVPLLAGLTTIGVALWIGRRWLGPLGTTCLVVLVSGGQWLAYYVVELKPYSGDVLWGLWLPALAAWAIDAAPRSVRHRRLRIWWLTAAVAHWLSLGALFVTPACAVVLIVTTWRREGIRSVMATMTPAGIWLLSFAALYGTTLRHAAGNTFLLDYWAFALAPDNASALSIGRWMVDRLAHLATKPGGTELPLLFWSMAVVGWWRSRHTLGILMVGPPVTGLVLALLGLYPLFERLSLWMMPAACVGVAQAAAWAGQLTWSRSLLPRVAVLIGVAALLADVAPRGYHELNVPTTLNHGLDDRAGVAWALAARRARSIVVTTEHTVPAVWWYGGVSLAAPQRGSHLPDETPILVARFSPAGSRCDLPAPAPHFDADQLVIYLGFRFDDLPPGFDQLLFDTLGTVGALRSLSDVPGVGRAAVVDLGVPSTMPRLPTLIGPPGAEAIGCVTFEPAARW